MAEVAVQIDPVTICLVGCGKAKVSRPAPAKELYVGSLFRAARRYAEACDGWWIVSAAHGLVDPEKVIQPYDAKLPRGLLARDGWGVKIASDLYGEMQDEESETSAHFHFEVVVLAGSDYADPICDHLTRLRVKFTRPLDGMRLGQRLSWLKRETIG